MTSHIYTLYVCMYTCMYVCHVHHVCMSCNKNKLRNYAYLKKIYFLLFKKRS